MHEYKYFAFISYCSLDVKWGKLLQRKLEHYRMPATLCSEHGWKRVPIRPVFFAPTDIQPGGLTEELQKRLSVSRNLIVICSPNSAQSEWVGKEIEFFHNIGRTKQIYFFIVDGVPYSKDKKRDCFNPIVETLGIPEILAPNIHEQIYRWPWLNKERAYVQLISKLLDVEFDAIWQRHKRLLIQKVSTWIIGILVLLSAWLFSIRSILPFTVELTVTDVTVNNNLPRYSGGIVTMYLADEVLKDSLCPVVDSGKSVFKQISRKYFNDKVRIKVECQNYNVVDTVMPLTEYMTLDVRRNPAIYGHIRFRLWDADRESFVANCSVTISDENIVLYNTVTDSLGYIDLNIPLDKQRIAYGVSASIPLETCFIYMPCGEDDVILTK